MATVAVLGTGLLGSGFALNLLDKGHTVRVWNRSMDKLAPLVERGAVAGADPADAVRGAERVHLVLTADDAVDAVLQQARPGLGQGVPVLDHSTNLPARVVDRCRRLRDDGVTYLSAPVFMSPQNAREATGMMLLSGPKDLAVAVEPALAAMTGKVWYCGERTDLAAFHKLSGNGLLLALTGVMGDLLAMGAAADLQPQEVLSLFEVWKPGAAIPFFGQRVATADTVPASFELQMARKDLGLMLECAGGPQRLSVLPAVAGAMDRAIDQGLGQRDFAIYAKADR
ncbi:MAG: NAD(P)-dependent oxidoreductase [Planctomycetota bacterium]